MQIGTKRHVQVSGDLDFKLDFEVIKSTYSEALESSFKVLSTWRSFKVKDVSLTDFFMYYTVKLSYIRLRGKNGKSACRENRRAFDHKELRNIFSTPFTNF